MTEDITLFDEVDPFDGIDSLDGADQETAAPPLCLVHYFGATGQGPPPQKGRIAERRGNVIVLEFAPPPKAALTKTARGKPRKPLLRKIGDTLFLLLLLVSLIACIAAFRF